MNTSPASSIARALLATILPFICASTSLAQPQLLWEREIGNDSYENMGCAEFCVNGDILCISQLETYAMRLDLHRPDGSRIWSREVQGHHGRELERIGPTRFATTYSEPLIAVFDLDDGFSFLSYVVNGHIQDIHRYENGTFLSCGEMGSNTSFVCRYHDDGTLMWLRGLGQDFNQHCYGITSTATGSIRPVSSSYAVIVYDITPEGVVEDSTVIYRQATQALHVAYGITTLPDGNLVVNGWLSLEPDSSYCGAKLSPDGEILNYWGHQGMWVSDPHYDLIMMPDGGSVEYRPHDWTWLEFTRYDATGAPIITWDYELTVRDYLVGIDDLNVTVNRAGEILVYGKYTYWLRGDNTETNIFASKFGVWHSDLEITVEPQRNLGNVQVPNSFTWHGILTNNTDSDITTDVWVIVRGPNGYPSEPLHVWQDINVPANGTFEADLQQTLPAEIPSGPYNYIVRAGTYEPGNPQHIIQDHFPFSVTNGSEAELDPPRVRGVVAAPFNGPEAASANTR